MTMIKGHAVVMGGSMAGLVAAQALAQHFARVTVIERDLPSDSDQPRKGVPQGRHLHVLLAAGLASLERMFPGFRRDALARGAIEVDIGGFGTLYLRGVLMPTLQTGCTSLMFSRTALERCVREQVQRRENITFLSGSSVEALLGSAAAITGVRVRVGPTDSVQEISADLVIDATGRGTKLPAWLKGFGLPQAPEDQVHSKVSYSSCTVRRGPSHLAGELAWVMTPTPPQTRFGAAQAWEGDRYIVSFTTYLGEPGPDSYAQMIDYAKGLPYPGLHALLATTEPLTEIAQMHDATSRRRRYERLRRFPSGLLVLGDALCNFNPAYGQGMSVASLEAEALERCLRSGLAGIAPRFFAAASKIVDAPWMLATGADLQWEAIEGKRAFGDGTINAYVARVIAAAGQDPVVAERLLRVMHLLSAPSSLFAPSILWRVLRAKTQRVGALGAPQRSDALPSNTAKGAREKLGPDMSVLGSPARRRPPTESPPA